MCDADAELAVNLFTVNFLRKSFRESPMSTKVLTQAVV